MRILLKGNQRYSRPKCRKLRTREDRFSKKPNADINKILNELDGQILFEDEKLLIKNLIHMDEEDINVLNKKKLKRASSSQPPEVRRRRGKRIWEGSEDSESSSDESSTECKNSCVSAKLPQHSLLPCLSGGKHNNSWVMLSETSSIPVEVQPSGCQDPNCQALRVNTSVPQIGNTTKISAPNVHQDTFTTSDLISCEEFAMISRSCFDLEELLSPFVPSKSHEYQNPDCSILPITQEALSITEGGVNQPQNLISRSTIYSMLHTNNNTEYYNDCDKVHIIPETLSSENYNGTASSISRTKSSTAIVTTECAVISTPTSFNEEWIIDGINSKENDTTAKLITVPYNDQQTQDHSMIFSDEDLNEEVFAAVEELLKNYSPDQFEFIDFDLPDGF